MLVFVLGGKEGGEGGEEAYAVQDSERSGACLRNRCRNASRRSLRRRLVFYEGGKWISI